MLKVACCSIAYYSFLGIITLLGDDTISHYVCHWP